MLLDATCAILRHTILSALHDIVHPYIVGRGEEASGRVVVSGQQTTPSRFERSQIRSDPTVQSCRAERSSRVRHSYMKLLSWDPARQACLRMLFLAAVASCTTLYRSPSTGRRSRWMDAQRVPLLTMGWRMHYSGALHLRSVCLRTLHDLGELGTED